VDNGKLFDTKGVDKLKAHLLNLDDVDKANQFWSYTLCAHLIFQQLYF